MEEDKAQGKAGHRVKGRPASEAFCVATTVNHGGKFGLFGEIPRLSRGILIRPDYLCAANSHRLIL